MSERSVAIPVEGGAVPTAVLGPDDASGVPGLFVVPSIFGGAPDLLKRLSEFADEALVVVPDPFWREGGGVVSYDNMEEARGRLGNFESRRCVSDLSTALDWTISQCNGQVIGLGICFGGPFCLRYAGEGRLRGVVTWHGSRMQDFLDRAPQTTCPMRHHFGEADPVTPPEVIEKVRAAYAHIDDVSIVAHPGAVHGFSHDGPGYDDGACRAGLDAVGELLGSLR